MAESQGSAGDKGSPAPGQITFHYVKSNFYRVVHADGVWGGVTPSQDIQMAFWNQRQAIPQEIVQELGIDGKVGRELGRHGKEGVVREIEVSVLMDLEEAKAFRDWLDDKIQALDRVVEGKKIG